MTLVLLRAGGFILTVLKGFHSMTAVLFYYFFLGNKRNQSKELLQMATQPTRTGVLYNVI